MTRHPKISLIFVNYKSSKQLRASLQSVVDFEGKQEGLFETIIVNNDVSETEMVKKLSSEQGCALIANDKNCGFGAAANKGAQQARGEFLGFLNPDTLWQKTCLQDIQKTFQEQPTLGILGLTLVATSGKPEEWSFGKDPTLCRIILNNFFHFEKRAHRNDMVVDWVSGAALFIRRDLFVRLGGFDENFFLYFEDVDLCRRVRAVGHDVLLTKGFPIVHYGGQSHMSTKKQKEYYYQSQEKYFKKYRTRTEQVLLRFFRIFSQRL